MSERVAVLSPDGQFGTVDAADAEAVVRAGGKVLSRAEVKERDLAEQYAKQGTAATVGKAASYLGPVPAGLYAGAQWAGIVQPGAMLPPEAEAYKQGVSEAFTGGVASLGEKELVRAVAGDKAATAYGKLAEDASEAHRGYNIAGQTAGFLGGAVAGGPRGGGALTKAIPGVAISEAGGLVERGAAGAIGKLAGEGVLGRAAATAGGLGARGAIEGALYGAASSASADLLGDHELNSDKLFAATGSGILFGGVGGAVLGGAGSLAKSGALATTGAIGRALSKPSKLASGAAVAADAATGEARAAVAEGVQAAETEAKRAVAGAKNAVADEVAATQREATKTAQGLAEATGTNLAQEERSLFAAVEKAKTPEEQKRWAFREAWKSLASGKGFTPTQFTKRAEAYLKNGVEDVGEWLLRKKVIDPEGGVINALRHGTPEDMVPRIEAERAAIGKALGDMTEASPARVSAKAIDDAIARVAKPLEDAGATKRAGTSVRSLGADIKASLGLRPPEEVATGLFDAKGRPIVQRVEGPKDVAIQALLDERKALDRVVFDNATVDPKLALEVKRNLRRELEGLVIEALDEAGGKLPGEVRAEYKALKHDYTAASIALELAEDSAARMGQGAVFGLTDTIRGAAAGGPLSGLATAIASKINRERGSAAAAVLIHRMADRGSITAAINAVDTAMGKAARGLLEAPKKAPLPERAPAEPIRVRAARIAERVASVQANSEQHADAVARHTEALRATAPQLAGGIEQRLTSAAAFLASKLPAQDRDPWDLHPAPRMSDAQAAQFVRYANYVERPMRVFEEAAHGKLTYEGVEVAKALMPGAFAELQQRTVMALADMMARGQRPPYAQRERLGILLYVPAVPAQRPDHMKLLQQLTAPSTPTKPNGPNRPMPTSKNPTSTLDRLEGK